MPSTIPTSLDERSAPIVAVVLSSHVGRNRTSDIAPHDVALAIRSVTASPPAARAA